MNTKALALTVGSVIACTDARAQSTHVPGVPGTQIPGVRVPQITDRPLDQGIADLDQLAVSMRQMPVNMHVDQGFETLWALPSNPDFLYRRDGGLTAVFPASEYAPTRKGTIALIPAGTVFYIGTPTMPPEPPRPGLVPAAGDDTRRDAAIRIEPLPAPDRLEELPAAEKITAQIAATPERRVITPQLADQGLPPLPEQEETLPEPPRADEHTMSNEAYRRLRLRNLIIRLADAR